MSNALYPGQLKAARMRSGGDAGEGMPGRGCRGGDAGEGARGRGRGRREEKPPPVLPGWVVVIGLRSNPRHWLKIFFNVLVEPIGKNHFFHK